MVALGRRGASHRVVGSAVGVCTGRSFSGFRYTCGRGPLVVRLVEWCAYRHDVPCGRRGRRVRGRVSRTSGVEAAGITPGIRASGRAHVGGPGCHPSAPVASGAPGGAAAQPAESDPPPFPVQYAAHGRRARAKRGPRRGHRDSRGVGRSTATLPVPLERGPNPARRGAGVRKGIPGDPGAPLR